jgi:hypothetical protein
VLCLQQKIINSWIQECQNNHPACILGPQAGVFLPTRLIDLGVSDSETCTLRLIETNKSNVPILTYATLSHCWGPVGTRTLTTTSLTLLNRLEGISFQSLPKNFQDAAIIIKSIGIRYLWIDSLCIIQDDENDWELESAKMGKVYLHSTCTIAASASGSSTEGFKERAIPISEACLVTKLDNWKIIPSDWKLQNERKWISEVDGSVMIKIFKPSCIPPIWDESFSGQPLNQRGWVLQERQLSRRVLHYTKSKLLWECRSLRACDDMPWGLSHGSAARKLRVLDGREGSWKGGIFNAWHYMTQDYSSMLLTKDTDKLGALSGMAKEVQRSLASNYIAGICGGEFLAEPIMASCSRKGP